MIASKNAAWKPFTPFVVINDANTRPQLKTAVTLQPPLCYALSACALQLCSDRNNWTRSFQTKFLLKLVLFNYSTMKHARCCRTTILEPLFSSSLLCSSQSVNICYSFTRSISDSISAVAQLPGSFTSSSFNPESFLRLLFSWLLFSDSLNYPIFFHYIGSANWLRVSDQRRCKRHGPSFVRG